MIYFEDGKLVAKSGKVRVYKYEGNLYLEVGPGHNLWADSLEIEEYKEQLGNTPRGDCLETGLGLGIVSKYILSCPNVTSLTTIEINKDVVEVQKKVNPINDKRHKIIIGDGVEYILNTSSKYDFIFIDSYTLIDEDTLVDIKAYVSTSKQILNKGGVIQAWWDIYTPDEFEGKFFELFKIER
jgi:predicted methyltransferase